MYFNRIIALTSANEQNALTSQNQKAKKLRFCSTNEQVI